jgi:hypothetical protein
LWQVGLCRTLLVNPAPKNPSPPKYGEMPLRKCGGHRRKDTSLEGTCAASRGKRVTVRMLDGSGSFTVLPLAMMFVLGKMGVKCGQVQCLCNVLRAQMCNRAPRKHPKGLGFHPSPRSSARGSLAHSRALPNPTDAYTQVHWQL